MLSVVCWLWRGKKPIYGPEHVHCLKRQCEAFFPPHRFVCVTDQPGVQCETYPLWDFPKVARTNPVLDCWRRLKLWDIDLGSQVLSIDLGVVIRDDITDLAHGDFAAMQGRFSHVNGGLFTMRPGTNRHIWDEFDPEVSPRTVEHICGSDQAWLSYRMPDCPVWTREQGIYRIQDVFRGEKVDERMRFVAFPGAIKPWHERVRRKARGIYDEYMKFYG